jgi:hypothetical protein
LSGILGHTGKSPWGLQQTRQEPSGSARFFLEKEAFGLYWFMEVPSLDDERIDAPINDLPVKKPFT